MDTMISLSLSLFLIRWFVLFAIIGGCAGITYATMVLDTKNQDSAVRKLLKVRAVLLFVGLLIAIEHVLETIIRIF